MKGGEESNIINSNTVNDSGIIKRKGPGGRHWGHIQPPNKTIKRQEVWSKSLGWGEGQNGR
jgi:hypothetical protein